MNVRKHPRRIFLGYGGWPRGGGEGGGGVQNRERSGANCGPAPGEVLTQSPSIVSTSRPR